MKLPNWFRIFWWIVLLFLLTWLLWFRFPAISNGIGVPADAFLFLVWVAIALLPLFQEISFFGMTFKQQFQELKTEVRDLKLEIRNSVDVRNQFSPTLTLFPTLTPDQLEQLAAEVKIRAEATPTVSKLAAEFGSKLTELLVPSEAEFLFRTRYALEEELRRLYRSRFVQGDVERPIPITKIIRALVEAELIDREAGVAAEELYRIASRVIHGSEVLTAQIKFAYDVSSWLLAELRAIK